MPAIRKPTKLKIMNGSAAHDPQRIADNEAEPEEYTRVPAPPSKLTKEAKVYWKQEAKKAYHMGTLTKADTEAFIDYCELLAERDKQHKADELHKWLKCLAALKDVRQKFGLTPSDRAGFSVPEKKPKSILGSL